MKIGTCNSCGGPVFRQLSATMQAIEQLFGPGNCLLCGREGEPDLERAYDVITMTMEVAARRGDPPCQHPTPVWALFLAAALKRHELSIVDIEAVNMARRRLAPELLIAVGDDVERLFRRWRDDVEARLTVVLENERAARNTAYAERNDLALALARAALALGWAAGRALDDDADDGWTCVVLVDLPTGQVSWHLPDGDPGWSALPEYPGRWDGHDPETKRHRLQRFLNGVAHP